MSLSLEIMVEQMEQRKGKSLRYIDKKKTGNDAVVVEDGDKDSSGAPDAMLCTTLRWEGTLCDPCHHLGHSSKGFEEFTLPALYEYCSIRPQDTVV